MYTCSCNEYNHTNSADAPLSIRMSASCLLVLVYWSPGIVTLSSAHRTVRKTSLQWVEVMWVELRSEENQAHSSRQEVDGNWTDHCLQPQRAEKHFRMPKMLSFEVGGLQEKTTTSSCTPVSQEDEYSRSSGLRFVVNNTWSPWPESAWFYPLCWCHPSDVT